jgi:hypothetical protein
MTIEQMVEIPADHRLILEVPLEIPAGKARVALTSEVTPVVESLPSVEAHKPVRPLRSLRGISKGLDTMDAYFERKRADKALEDANDERQRQESERYHRGSK